MIPLPRNLVKNLLIRTDMEMKKLMMAAAVLLFSLTACAQETIKLPVPDKSKATMSVMDALTQRLEFFKSMGCPVLTGLWFP